MLWCSNFQDSDTCTVIAFNMVIPIKNVAVGACQELYWCVRV